MNLTLKRVAVATSLCLAAAHGMAQPAAGGDEQPVRIIIPFSAGGQLDALGRYFAEKLGKRMNTVVIVENRAGASGMIGALTAVRAKPDGRTLFFTTGGPVSMAPHLHAKMQYNPQTELAPVAMVADMPMALVVRPDSPYKTVRDLIADARSRPDTVTVANTGQGTISHLSALLLAQAEGVKLVGIPYQSVTAVTDLLGGQTDALIASATSLENLVSTRKLRVLGTFSSQRLPTMGDAPTVAEATGVKGLEFPVWLGVMVPTKTPPEVVARLSQDLLAVCRQPETAEKFHDIMSCAGSGELGSVIAEDSKRWGDIIRSNNIKAEK